MPMLQDLDLSKNYQISGTLPEAWGNATGPGAGLQSFKHFSVRSCNLTGTLPASWATGLSGLATLDLAYNYITGVWRSRLRSEHEQCNGCQICPVACCWCELPGQASVSNARVITSVPGGQCCC